MLQKTGAESKSYLEHPVVIGVGGLSSSVGKTTLMCYLLQVFPGWEAIKTTRGHYRSCGKDAEACCVSHLLGEEPLIRSGRADTYTRGKDTGRYWDAGASNVHWLIATENQIGRGIQQTLQRVQSEGVFIEGNSFSQFVRTDYFVMVKRSGLESIKKSARVLMPKVSSLFVFDDNQSALVGHSVEGLENDRPVFTQPHFNSLVSHLRNAIATKH